VKRVAEVAAHQPPHPPAVLDGERLIEPVEVPELLVDALRHRGVRDLRGLELSRIAGRELDHAEGNESDAEQGDEAASETA
jgi:hypothetical protein